MKSAFYKIIISLFLLLAAVAVNAHDFEVDGIYYNFGAGNTALVTHQGALATTYNGEYIGNVVIPDVVNFGGTTYTVTTIEEETFYNCPDVTSIVVGNNVSTIGYNAFLYCTGLTSLTLGKSVTTLYGSLDTYNTSLNEIISYATTPPTVGYIEIGHLPVKAIYVPNESYDAYKTDRNWGMKNIIKLEPEVGDKFWYEGLYYCVIDNLAKCVEVAYKGSDNKFAEPTLTVPESIIVKKHPYQVSAIGDSAFYKSNLTDITMPGSITKIGKYAFSGCNITMVNIPNSVASIGDYAFYDCRLLTKLEIGSGVTSIGEETFTKCKRITSIICNATAPPTIKSTSLYELNQVPLIVPKGSLAAYQSAPYWRGFGNIVEAGQSLPVGTKFEKDNVYYNVTDATVKTVEVTYKGKSTSEYQDWYTGLIVIPDSVTYGGTQYCVTAIGSYAFYHCDYVTSLTIGSNIVEIDKDAFYVGCGSLNSIIVDSNNIVYDSRDNCNAIVETATNKIVLGAIDTQIPASVSTIGRSAFNDRYIKSIIIPNNITHIEEFAFTSSLLESVYISDIAAWCNISFENAEANPLCEAKKLYLDNELVTELVLPDNVTSISDYAFCDYDALTYIDFGNSVSSIGVNAFARCDGLVRITIPENITNIAEGAFIRCSGLKTLYFNAENCIIPNTNFPPFAMCDNFQQLVIGDRVKVVPDNAFDDCTNLNDITIGKSVTRIGNYAFTNCTSITNIILPEGLAEIGFHSFYNCTSLTSINVPNRVTYIGGQAFLGCSGLADVTIGSGVMNIGDRAFENCTGLKHLVIVDSDSTLNVGVISNAAFGGPGQGAFAHSPIETLYLGRNLTGNNSGYSPFYDTPELQTVTISEKVTEIPDYLFYNCSGLTAITIPGSVASISGSAFVGCTNINTISVAPENAIYDSRDNCNSVIHTATNTLMIGCKNSVIPSDIKTIAANAFNGCVGLKQVTIPDNVETIGYRAFRNCVDLTELNIGNGVKTIGEEAFEECIGLTQVVIPNSVETIDEHAFAYCSGMTEIYLGSGIKELDYYFIYDCTALAKITCLAVEPPTAYGWTFSGVDKTIPVYVLEESIEAYKNSSQWGAFLNFIALPKEGTVATPVISVSGRTVTITCETPQATVYYTTDGTEPTTESDVYTQPIRINSNCVVRAMATRTNYYGSEAVVTEIDNIINFAFAQENTRVEYSGTKFVPEILISGNADFATAIRYVSAYRVEDEEEILADVNNLVNAGYYRLVLAADDDNIYAQDEMYVYIKKAYMTIEPYYVKRKYGEDNPSFTFKIYGLVNNETESVLLTKPTITTTATSTSDVGEYPITASGAVALNYEFIYWSSTLIIEKAPLTITAEDKTIDYGAELPEFTFVAQGFCFDDTIDDIDELPTISCDISSTTLSGTYPITLIGGSDNNYELILVGGSLTILEQPTILAEAITLDYESVTLSEGQSVLLVATILPADVTNHNVVWSSDDETIATVDSYGVVTAVGSGETVVTATTIDGTNLSAQCEIIVEQSGIIKNGNSRVSIITVDGNIVVENATLDSRIEIYSLAGLLIESREVTDNITRIAINTRGVYIVKVGDIVKKVRI